MTGAKLAFGPEALDRAAEAYEIGGVCAAHGKCGGGCQTAHKHRMKLALLAAEDAGSRHDDTQRCAQCGREGTRGFRTLTAERGGGMYKRAPSITVCANMNACRKRWPRDSGDDA